MGVTVDEAGDDATAGGVDTGVADCAARLDRLHRLTVDDERHVAPQTEHAVAVLVAVGDEQSDVVDHERHDAASRRRGSRPRARRRRRDCSGADHARRGAAVDDDVGHVSGGRGIDDRRERIIGRHAGGARRTHVDGYEVSGGADRNHAGLGPPQRTMPFGGCGGEQICDEVGAARRPKRAARRARPRAPPRTGRSPHASRTRGTSAHPRSRNRRSAIPSARSRSVVGHMHTVLCEFASKVTSCSVRCVACTAVKRSLSTPRSAWTPSGERP